MRSNGVLWVSTFFYSYLRQGVENVSNWKLATDDVNVLQKKFMFIPMNMKKKKMSHWALAVVVNAGYIDNGVLYANGGSKNTQFNKNTYAPCILYLDSGDADFNQTKANKNCRVIRAWLNSKMQSNTDDNVCEKYTYKKGNVCSMKTIPVKVPLQENDIDCGPFVCVFASQLLKLMDYKFTFNDVEDKCKSAITESKFFQFGTHEITKFRASYQGVVNGLIHYYKKGKNNPNEGNKK